MANNDERSSSVYLVKVDRRRGGGTTLGNGQAWGSPSPRRQWRTDKKEEIGGEIKRGAPTTPTVKGTGESEGD